MDAANPCADYLASLDEALRGPRRLRRSLLREVGDHLEDATDAYLAVGVDPHTAETRAVADFGTVEEVAPSFQTTLAVASARRTSLLLLTVLAVQPFVWDDDAGAAPDGWLYALLDGGVEVFGMLVLAVALLAALACGIGNRWFRAGRAVARLTGWFTVVSGGLMMAIGTTLTVLASELTLGHWTLLGLFILAPMAITTAAARRTLAAC